MVAPKTLPLTDENLRLALALSPESVSLQSLARAFDIKDAGMPALRDTLESLVEDGFALSERDGQYRALRPMSDLVIARVSGSLTDRKQKIGLTIENLDRPLPFPVTVNAKLLRRKFGHAALGPNERIAVVLERHHGTGLIASQVIDKFRINRAPSIVGHFTASAGQVFRAYTSGIRTDFSTFGKIPEAVSPRTAFFARIPPTLDPFNPALEIAEQKWDPDTGIPIASIIAAKHGVRHVHSKPAAQEAKRATRGPTPFRYRRDLTAEPILVIDPADARDHDDGILIERTRDGYRTLVVVADVPHYVRPGGELDREARDRGFTHYFPDDTYHMLPPRLARHASLREGHSKPVIYVEQFWDEDGASLGEPEIGAGVIARQRQMTYGAFEDLVIARSPDIASYLELGDALVERMRFEKVTFDVDDKDNRTSYSQMIVAALMIEANTAIAGHLLYSNVPFLSRAHSGSDNPYAFAELKARLEDWGYDVPSHISQMTNEGLRRIIAQSEERGDKRRVESAIRADFLNQAVYSVNPFGHFGLNRENYTHATSPIRRYADILTLRAVHTSLGDPDLGLSDRDVAALPETARLLNIRQDITRRVSLDVDKYYAVRDLQRLEGHWVRASLARVEDGRAEIVLGGRHALRKHLSPRDLPDGWAFGRNGKSLVYKDNLPVPPGQLRVRLHNIRPHMGDWDIAGMACPSARLRNRPASPRPVPA